MSEKIFELNIPADDEGYIAFECPYCGIRFKLEAEEFKTSSIIDLYCPACGLVNQINSFYTHEVIEKAEEIAMNHILHHRFNLPFRFCVIGPACPWGEPCG